MKIEVGEYKTRYGLKARVLMTDGGGTKPLIGAVFVCGSWHAHQWMEDGKYSTSGARDQLDLVLTRRLWVPIFDTVDGKILLGPARETDDEARAYARGTWALPAGSPTPRLVAVVPIEFAEGDGLEEGRG